MQKRGYVNKLTHAALVVSLLSCSDAVIGPAQAVTTVVGDWVGLLPGAFGPDTLTLTLSTMGKDSLSGEARRTMGVPGFEERFVVSGRFRSPRVDVALLRRRPTRLDSLFGNPSFSGNVVNGTLTGQYQEFVVTSPVTFRRP